MEVLGLSEKSFLVFMLFNLQKRERFNGSGWVYGKVLDEDKNFA